MAIDPISSTGVSGATKSAQTSTGLDKDDFLKILVGQLQHQDPMSPTDSSEWIGQLTGFSTLEQITNMAVANDKLAGSLAISQQVGLIGKTVSYMGDDGALVDGVVDSVDIVDGTSSLTIGGVAGIALEQVVTVR